MNDRDEALLDAIAYQARWAYATQQLAESHAARQLYKQLAEHGETELSRTRAQLEVTYQEQEIVRWQHYLNELGQRPAS